MLARKPAIVGIVAHRAVRFSGDDDALSSGAKILQSSAEDLFRYAQRIHVGCIEEIEPEVESLPNNRPALLFFEGPFPPGSRPEAHRSKRKSRNLQTCRTK